MQRSMDRRTILSTALAFGAFAAVRPIAAGAAAIEDEASKPPHAPLSPFGGELVPYDEQHRMADKVAMMRELPSRTEHWRVAARRFEGLNRLSQLDAVNRFVNRMPYVSDQIRFKAEDRWDGIMRFLGHGGDCEEYALAKYAFLSHLGFHPDRMGVIALMRHADGYGHMVLMVELDGANWVLDQLKKDVLSDADYPGHSVVYAMNAAGVRVPAKG